jgi:hypothetical protein
VRKARVLESRKKFCSGSDPEIGKQKDKYFSGVFIARIFPVFLSQCGSGSKVPNRIHAGILFRLLSLKKLNFYMKNIRKGDKKVKKHLSTKEQKPF